MRRATALLASAGVALTFGVVSLFAASALSFVEATDYPTGKGPSALAIGDLNGDGRADVVTTNYWNRASNTVSVLLNKGAGRFMAKRDYVTARGPYAVSIGDVNGDHRPDVITANPDPNNVSVLLNKGDGSFRAHRDYATGIEPSGIAIGDLNGDGRPDLVTANSKANTVSVLLNQGSAGFQPKRDYATDRDPEAVAIGDLNGDGKLDLATANFEDVSVLLNGGSGTLARHDLQTGTEASYESIAIGDVNADGKPDLAAGDVDDMEVDVFRNGGGGVFESDAYDGYDTGDYGPASVAIGDLNSDGKPDLATANPEAATASVFANEGDGRFGSAHDLFTGAGPYSVAIGDLNRDGKPDLATANSEDGTVSVLLNRSGPCKVPDVRGKTQPVASRAIFVAGCSPGKTARVYSNAVARDRVVAQLPRPGTKLAHGSKVVLVLSRGRRR